RDPPPRLVHPVERAVDERPDEREDADRHEDLDERQPARSSPPGPERPRLHRLPGSLPGPGLVTGGPPVPGIPGSVPPDPVLALDAAFRSAPASAAPGPPICGAVNHCTISMSCSRSPSFQVTLTVTRRALASKSGLS